MTVTGPAGTGKTLLALHAGIINLFNKKHEMEYQSVISKEINPAGTQIKMGEIINILSQLTKGQAIIVADVGQNQMMSVFPAWYLWVPQSMWILARYLIT